MYNKKRGLILVVLFLVVLGALAEGWVQPEQDSLGDDEDVEELVYKYGYRKSSWAGGNLQWADSKQSEKDFCEGTFTGGESWGKPDYSDCGATNDPNIFVPCCALQLTKKEECDLFDWSCNDKCSGVYVKGGTLFKGWQDTSLEYVGEDWESGGDGGGYHPNQLRANDEFASFICDEHRWKECSNSNIGDFLDVPTWDGEALVHNAYFCTASLILGETRYLWATVEDSGADKDGDGVPILFDCDDNDDQVYGDFSAYGDPELKPVEICGDGKNNDCLGGTATGNLYDPGPNGDSSDDCDDNKFACQGEIAKIGEDGKIIGEPSDKTGCLKSGRKCEWIESVGGNSCCGDDGITELGETEEDGSGEYICLKNDEEVVGAAGGVIEDCEASEGEWCWVEKR